MRQSRKVKDTVSSGVRRTHWNLGSATDSGPGPREPHLSEVVILARESGCPRAQHTPGTPPAPADMSLS